MNLKNTAIYRGTVISVRSSVLNRYHMVFISREIARQDGIWMKEYFFVEAVIFDLLRKDAVLMIVEISIVKNNSLSLL